LQEIASSPVAPRNDFYSLSYFRDVTLATILGHQGVVNGVFTLYLRGIYCIFDKLMGTRAALRI
jgi:hypothetical protein